jgi:hypothetical protein
MHAGTATLLTPASYGPAIELGNRTWSKKILPVGSIDYQGRQIHFIRDYLRGLVEAWRDQAYDQVPLQFADSDNRHSNDPERTRGWITDMQLADDGLYVTAQVTPRGEQVLRDNPYLGVSARIVEQYARSDGRFYPAAIQHVLATLDPRITGLGAWSPVEMSNSGGLIIDLSGASWAGEPGPFDGLSGAELEDLMDAISESDDDEAADDELAAWVDSLSDAELAALEAEALADQAALADGYGGADDGPFSEFSDAFEDSYAAQQARQQAREAAALEDMMLPVRTDEDRLARALSRISAGIYTDPAAAQGAALANESRAIELAAATGKGPCGPVDDFGRCSSRYHDLECAHGVSVDWQATGPHRATSEAALANFAAEHFPGTIPQFVVGDTDDPDYADAPVPQRTVELAHRLAGQMGLHGSSALPVAPSWDELFGTPYTGDMYSELAGEVGLPGRQAGAPPQVNPAVHQLAQDLGLVT